MSCKFQCSANNFMQDKNINITLLEASAFSAHSTISMKTICIMTMLLHITFNYYVGVFVLYLVLFKLNMCILT